MKERIGKRELLCLCVCLVGPLAAVCMHVLALVTEVRHSWWSVLESMAFVPANLASMVLGGRALGGAMPLQRCTSKACARTLQ